MSSLADPKTALRRQALERRRAVDAPTRAAFGARLAEVGLDCARRWRPRVVSAFVSLRDEPDTADLLAALQQDGFATALPTTAGQDEPLVFRLWRAGEPLIRGAWVFASPASAEALDPDLLFVPLACFDRRGHRIGYGAGPL